MPHLKLLVRVLLIDLVVSEIRAIAVVVASGVSAALMRCPRMSPR
jgi:hypothetical protein